ncbi:MAG TPA: ferredoxin [bacterium]|nr:ferredoxin [bacterium]
MDENKRKIVRVEIDSKACISCGTCTVLAPKAFEIDDQGHSIVKDSWKELSDEEIIKAAKACPSEAIMLFDEEGKRMEL